VTVRPIPPRRGRVGLYAAGFILLMVAAYVLFRANVESSLNFVWVSIGLAGLAAGLAIVSVLVPARPGPARPEATGHPSTSERDPSSADED
jgi:hypothetical protein